MAQVRINGSTIVYEILGDGPPLILTPGGRFGKDVPGLRPLAEKLAQSHAVVIWDRPNTGASDLKFTGVSESRMAADDLVRLLEALELIPAVFAGGSAGSRVSLIAAAHYPEALTKLVMWNMSGGRFGTMWLAYRYLLLHIDAAWREGMSAVAELPDMQESIRLNPANKQILLDLDREEFIETLTRWLDAYVPRADQPLPGVPAVDVKRITAPTLIFRNGDDDVYHPAATSQELHRLVPNSQLAEPPWPRDAWLRTMRRVRAGQAEMFEDWHLLAPTILEFLQE